MLTKFRYNIPNTILPLMNEAIADYPYDYLIGYLDTSLVGQLRHCSLYMVCQYEEVQGSYFNKNPIAIVAKNNNSALEIYYEATGNKDGTVFCEIVNRCDNITVTAI